MKRPNRSSYTGAPCADARMIVGRGSCALTGRPMAWGRCRRRIDFASYAKAYFTHGDDAGAFVSQVTASRGPAVGLGNAVAAKIHPAASPIRRLLGQGLLCNLTRLPAAGALCGGHCGTGACCGATVGSGWGRHVTGNGGRHCPYITRADRSRA
jgi:hypothetical protein